METRVPQKVTPEWMTGRERLPWSWVVEHLKDERNEKFGWDFDVDGDGLNFFVRPNRIYAWQSTPTEVVASSKFVIS